MKKRSTMFGHYTLQSFRILCVGVQHGTFVFCQCVCVCVLLITFSVTCKSAPSVGSGSGWRAVLVQMFPRQFVFCNDDASIRREVAVSPSSSLWLHTVLCALCSLPKVWRHSFAGAILGKSCRASFFFFFCPHWNILL